MTLRVALDLSCLEVRPETGVERYARRLAEVLPVMAPEVECVVVVRQTDAAPAIQLPGRLEVLPSVLPRVLWREAVLPRALRKWGVQVLHSPVAAIPFRCSVPRVATIHDVPSTWDTDGGGRLSRHRLRLLHAAKSAALLVVPSVATQRALVALDPRLEPRIAVIPHGVDIDFRPDGLSLQRERYGIPPGRYLLWVGTIRPRKDPLVLVRAFARLLEEGFDDLHLVMCGISRIDADELRDPLTEIGMEDRLVLAGYVAREDLPSLYRDAEMMVVPSRIEGFGMPALEAMASGKPVVTSQDAALQEIGGEATVTFRTGDSDDLARVLREILMNPEEAHRLGAVARDRALKFSWEHAARAHATAYSVAFSGAGFAP